MKIRYKERFPFAKWTQYLANGGGPSWGRQDIINKFLLKPGLKKSSGTQKIILTREKEKASKLTWKKIKSYSEKLEWQQWTQQWCSYCFTLQMPLENFQLHVSFLKLTFYSESLLTSP